MSILDIARMLAEREGADPSSLRVDSVEIDDDGNYVVEVSCRKPSPIEYIDVEVRVE